MSDNLDNWFLVSEVDGTEVEDIIRFDYNDNTYCIYRLEDGFYATDGICTHESVHLEEGLVMEGNKIECPMHQGIFNIKTGKAVSPPACDDLKTYPVKVEENKIYIQLI